MTEIGFKCFEEYQGIKTLELNKNIEVIGVKAFEECENLVEVTGGINVRKVDSCAFYKCGNLKKVDLGEQLEEIDVLAFADCSSLKKMESQNNLVNIGELAFCDSALENFMFNRNVEIGSRAFDDTEWIANQPEEFVIYGDGNLIGYNGNDEIVNIPEKIKTVNGGCFDGTTAQEIYLPNTVTTVREYVFIDCNDVRVYIPDSVVHMGDEEQRYPVVDDDATIIIITTAGSYAEQYAIENEIPYEIVEGW